MGNTITFDMSSSLSSRASTISSTTTSFHSYSRQSGVSRFSSGGGTSRRAFVVSNAAQISFVRDSVETCVPDVKLTKSRDGTSGTAFFYVRKPRRVRRRARRHHGNVHGRRRRRDDDGGRERKIRQRETEVHRSSIHHANESRVGEIHAFHDAIRRGQRP